MLSQQLVAQTKKLEELEFEEFTKVISYSINLILNRSNQIGLHEFMRVDKDEGEELSNTCLNLIRHFLNFRSSPKQMQQQLSLLPLSASKVNHFQQKLEPNIYELRKIAFSADLKQITHFKDLEWRMEIEMSSKTEKNVFRPNMLFDLITEQNGKECHNIMNCDFANLKNLHDNLMTAMKLHKSKQVTAVNKTSL